ncbi:hypothetical protein ColTof4_13950 [Colletotrichum tofieldiae]|uniref:Uncharacterized protein n=2 Tax=Colletotrichum spaethianum species complex TaxID=2707349 RepID=A0A166S8C4_9PEZI|nr:hypothetical protein CT0861_09571 [Colletotrichum tofieldiae]GJC77169.1 hypothetical protein ColLi_00007 [Colletotrichum liriopes]GKT56167.1 hypothetical protein ColTof3_03506 [Colletotrichum tofieldiae]GKT81527.1 hypothetical protein ColTof4_13950 [Colletotrichum tofieldiae]GKT82155.1 hypothetical protein Ct61P_00005 [Colletotrichum tofieldiae]
MQFSLATVLLGFAAVACASVTDVEGIRNAARDAVIVDRQAGNGGRPTPNGQCCVANTSLKQDTCTVNGQQGRCVPGGQPCGGSLSCVAQANLACVNNIQERGKNLCRAKAGNGFIDGANTITNLNQAKVN